MAVLQQLSSAKPENVFVSPPLERGTRVCVHSLSSGKDHYNGTYGVVVEVIDNSTKYHVDEPNKSSRHRLLVKRQNLKPAIRCQGGTQLLNLAREDHFAGVVNRHSVTVVGFFTNWCGPCRRLQLVFERLAKDSHDIPQSMAFAFLSVNPNNFSALTRSCGITGYANVRFYIDGRPLHHLRITGYDPNGLQDAVKMLTTKGRIRAPSPAAPLYCPVPSPHGYSAFLSHDWGDANKNHERVKLVNSLLREEKINTWFDEQSPKQGGMKVLFITKNYMQKLKSTGIDNCKREYRFANNKWADDCSATIKVVMEPDLLEPKEWFGEVFCDHSGDLFIDMSSDSKFKSNIGFLVRAILDRKSRLSYCTDVGHMLTAR